MPLINQEIKIKRNQIRFYIDINVLADLESYGRFIHSSRDFVVENVLSFFFKKDREFQDWLASNTVAGEVKPAAVAGSANEPAAPINPARPPRPKPTTGEAA